MDRGLDPAAGADRGVPRWVTKPLFESAVRLFYDARQSAFSTNYAAQFYMRAYPLFLMNFLSCLDAFEGNLRYADENADRKMKGQKVASWETFERQRIAHYKKLPPFLCTMTLLTVIAFLVQGKFEGWKHTDMVLVTSRITEHKEWYRIFTSIFMHSRAVHLCVNIFFMWMYGFFLENKYGSILVGSIFTMSALGGSLARAVFTPYGGAVGIAGGWFGFIGMGYVVLWKHWWLYKRIHLSLQPRRFNPLELPFAIGLVMEGGVLVLLFSLQPYVTQVGCLSGIGFSSIFIASKRYPDSIIFDYYGGLRPRNVKLQPLFATTLACFLKAVHYLWQSGNIKLFIYHNCCRAGVSYQPGGSHQLDTNGFVELSYYEADWDGRGTSDQFTRQLINILHQIVCYGRDGQGLHCWELETPPSRMPWLITWAAAVLISDMYFSIACVLYVLVKS